MGAGSYRPLVNCKLRRRVSFNVCSARHALNHSIALHFGALSSERKCVSCGDAAPRSALPRLLGGAWVRAVAKETRD